MPYATYAVTKLLDLNEMHPIVFVYNLLFLLRHVPEDGSGEPKHVVQK
jgi:hypothetical protein